MRAFAVVTAISVSMFAGCSPSLSPTAPSAVVSSTAAPAFASTGTNVSSRQVDKQVPFNGTIDGFGVIAFDPPPSPFFAVSLHASGQASHLGRYTLDVPHRVDTRDGTARGTFVFTAANGDTVSGDFTGASAPTATANVFAITETSTITGGTGRFAGANGSFVTHRTVDLVTGLTSGSFSGSISSPGSTER